MKYMQSVFLPQALRSVIFQYLAGSPCCLQRRGFTQSPSRNNRWQTVTMGTATAESNTKPSERSHPIDITVDIGERRREAPVVSPSGEVAHSSSSSSSSSCSCSSTEQLGALATLIQQQYESMTPEAEIYDLRLAVFEQIDQALQKRSDWVLLAFGSLVSTLCTMSSDLDLCLVGKDGTANFNRFKKIEMLNQARKILNSFAPLTVIHATIPVLKKSGAPKGLALDFDLSVQSDGVVNSYWLRQYITTYPFIRPLALMIKTWSKQWHVYGPTNSRFNSYTLVLLLLYYLTQEGHIPAILPQCADLAQSGNSVYPLFPRFPPLHIFLRNDVDYAQCARLLQGFFQFYQTFDVRSRVVCLSQPVEQARALHPKAKSWDTRRCVYVEDPFLRHVNSARNVPWAHWVKCQSAMQVAAQCCGSDPASLLTSNSLISRWTWPREEAQNTGSFLWALEGESSAPENQRRRTSARDAKEWAKVVDPRDSLWNQHHE